MILGGRVLALDERLKMGAVNIAVYILLLVLSYHFFGIKKKHCSQS